MPNQPDEPNTLLVQAAFGAENSDDGHIGPLPSIASRCIKAFPTKVPSIIDGQRKQFGNIIGLIGLVE